MTETWILRWAVLGLACALAYAGATRHHVPAYCPAPNVMQLAPEEIYGSPKPGVWL